MASQRLTLRLGERTLVVSVQPEADQSNLFNVDVDGQRLRLRVDGQAIKVDGRSRGPAWVAGSGEARWVYYDGRVYHLEVQREGGRGRARQPGSLAAPMPATVRQIRVAVGDRVAHGDTLVVLEAMKMELPVRADADGTVVDILCREGELVQPGRPLIRLGERA